MSPLEPPYTRLLVERYEPTFRFYTAVLPKLTGCSLARGTEASGYASWDDCEGRTAFAVFSRAAMTAAVGEENVPVGASVVIRVDGPGALDAAVDLCASAGATVIAPAQDRPQWGPTMRAAHLHDPDGNLVELQTY
ncbi:VOC family protein [Streptomyces sp. YS-3]|uniref:VOC family protein n=1 Tax=Streptomyces sp. YS-3 TaxID=3381352 RepID=UPI0038626163